MLYSLYVFPPVPLASQGGETHSAAGRPMIRSHAWVGQEGPIQAPPEFSEQAFWLEGAESYT